MSAHPSRQHDHDHERLVGRLVRRGSKYRVADQDEPWGERNVPPGAEGTIIDVFLPTSLVLPVQYRMAWLRVRDTIAYIDCMCVDLLPEVPNLADVDALEEWLRRAS